jgi:UDP-N-acetyl-D-mannosaminuronic acid dehydrogenase
MTFKNVIFEKRDKMSAINVIGLGYIGLPTALILAKNGFEIIGTDYNAKLVENLKNGNLNFDEKGLKELFETAKNNQIKFKTEYMSTDKYIVAVPTPYLKESKKIDATYVKNAIKSILDKCNKGAIIVIESTISPGTIEKYIKPIIIERGFKLGEDIHIAHAPERVIPGNMIYELENNSRIIGTDEEKIGKEISTWYKSFCKGDIVVTSIKIAEISKVIENTFRDVNIAFANELAKICNREDLDVYEAINIANKHPRVNILQPGPGVGGHCIAVDPWFLVGDYPDVVNVILGARQVNDSMPQYVFNQIKKIMKENDIIDYSLVGIYGLTYKENVNDIRESPAIQLLEVMRENDISNIKSYDPFVTVQNFSNQCESLEKFLMQVKIVVVLVSHNEIKEKQKLLYNKVVYDTKNIINYGKKIYKL